MRFTQYIIYQFAILDIFLAKNAELNLTMRKQHRIIIHVQCDNRTEGRRNDAPD